MSMGVGNDISIQFLASAHCIETNFDASVGSVACIEVHSNGLVGMHMIFCTVSHRRLSSTALQTL